MKRTSTTVGRRRFGYFGAVAVSALLFGLTACGSSDGSDNADKAETPSVEASWDDVVAAANDEGKVTLYSSQELNRLNEIEKAFEAEYPDIDMVVFRGAPHEIQPKVEVEKSTGKGIADVVQVPDAGIMEAYDEDDYFTAAVGPSFEAAELADDPDNVPTGTFFRSHGVVRGYGWNTDLYPEGLSSAEDLLDPALKGGKVGVLEPANASIVDLWMFLERAHGEDFVDRLLAQEPRIYTTGGPMQEALISGEIRASIMASSGGDDARDAGAPIDRVVPDKPWGQSYWAGILAHAPNPNAAQVLTDWLMSEDGQAVMARGDASVLPNIEGAQVTVDVIEPLAEGLDSDAVTAYLNDWKSKF